MMPSGQVDAVARQAGGGVRATLPDARARGARLCSDSRLIEAGDVFFAWPGGAGDGRRHLMQAIEAGAAASIVELDGFVDPRDESSRDGVSQSAVPVLPVAGLRERAGRIAAEWLGRPSARLAVVAVTGTNGKTSCSQWIATGCNARAKRPVAAVIGTLGAGVPGKSDPSAPRTAASTGGLTTPDALAIQHLFRDFVDAGLAVAAIEASSIGLVQGRLEGTDIAVAVMTNLTRDHLDFHGTLDAYLEAKTRLFRWPGLKAAVFNLDDPAAVAMSRVLAKDVARIGFTVQSARAASTEIGAETDKTLVRVTGVLPDAQGSIVLSIGKEQARLRLAAVGRFNLSNALAVAGVWHALGWSFAEIVDALAALKPVPGRLERISLEATSASDPASYSPSNPPSNPPSDPPSDPGRCQDAGLVNAPLPLVVVDYAHTPDALVNVLETMREVAQRNAGRLWCVFGAGGNRDRGKRAPMAAAVEAGADELVLTSDNPRDEDPLSILDDLRGGLTRAARVVEPDRREAIARAIALAAADDVIVIAGKGHEDYQEVRGVRTPFSDAGEARRALAVRRERGVGSGRGVGRVD